MLKDFWLARITYDRIDYSRNNAAKFFYRHGTQTIKNEKALNLNKVWSLYITNHNKLYIPEITHEQFMLLHLLCIISTVSALQRGLNSFAYIFQSTWRGAQVRGGGERREGE